MIAKEMERKGGLFRRSTFALVTSMAPASERDFVEEWARFECEVRAFRSRRGKRAERIALTLVVDPPNAEQARVLLACRTQASAFRELVGGLAVEAKVLVEEDEPCLAEVGETVRHASVGVEYSVPLRWTVKVEEGGAELLREGGAGEGYVIPGLAPDPPTLTCAESVRRMVLSRGDRIEEEDEAAAADGIELVTIIGRRAGDGEWVVAAGQRHPDLGWFVFAALMGPEREPLQEALDVIVGTMEWTDLALARSWS